MKVAGSIAFAFFVGVAACGSFESTPSTNATDAGTEGGAGDSGTEGASPPKPFCANFDPKGARVLWCRDFDNGDLATENWSGVENDKPGSSLALDSMKSASPPSSFVARVEAGSAGCTYAGARRELGSLPEQTRVSFDVLLGGQGTDPAVGTNFLQLEFFGCLVLFKANQERGEAQVQANGVDEFHPLINKYPKEGTWSHVELALDRPNNTLDVVIDGTRALDTGPVTLLQECLTPERSLTIYAGIACSDMLPSAREVHLDNIVVTASP